MSAAQPIAKVVDLSQYSIAQLENMLQTLTIQKNEFSRMLSTMRDTSQKAETALGALECMKEGNENNEIFIPVSANVMVPGKLNSTSNVFVSVGAGYVVEKTTSDAQEFFKSQATLLEGSIKSVRSQAMSLEDQIYAIQKVVELKKAQQQQQATQKPFYVSSNKQIIISAFELYVELQTEKEGH